MSNSRKKTSEIRTEYFLKGLLLGISTTVALGAIGGFITYRIMLLRRRKPYERDLYKFHAEGGISADAAIDEPSVGFKDESERIEKEYEMQLQEYADAEEALKHLTENM